MSLVVAGALVLTSSSAPGTARRASRSARTTAAVVERYRGEQQLERYEQVGGNDVGDVVAVLVHGCCGDHRDMADLARALTRRGALVLNLDVHAFGHGGGWPETYDDVVCGVATARAAARGGQRVALLGWDDGALVASAVALGWTTFAARATGCDAPVPHVGPDELIGISGHYGWIGEPSPDLVTDATTKWFGGDPSSNPVAWSFGNPGHWLRAAEGHPRVLVLATAGDTRAAAWAASLTDAGIDATSLSCGPGGHPDLTLPRTMAGAVAFGELAAWLGLQPGRSPADVGSDDTYACRR